MPSFIITFGQTHVHSINGKTFDSDCVARVEAEDEEVAREYFLPKFCFSYPEDIFPMESLRYYPRGIINVDVS